MSGSFKGPPEFINEVQHPPKVLQWASISASPKDDQAQKDLQSRDFFSSHTAKAKLASIGDIQVLPLEVIAETA